jgi:hypothetical protein
VVRIAGSSPARDLGLSFSPLQDDRDDGITEQEPSAIEAERPDRAVIRQGPARVEQGELVRLDQIARRHDDPLRVAVADQRGRVGDRSTR